MDDRATEKELVRSSLLFLSDEPGDAVVTEVYREELQTVDGIKVEVTTTVMTDCKNGDEIVRNNWI